MFPSIFVCGCWFFCLQTSCGSFMFICILVSAKTILLELLLWNSISLKRQDHFEYHTLAVLHFLFFIILFHHIFKITSSIIVSLLLCDNFFEYLSSSSIIEAIVWKDFDLNTACIIINASINTIPIDCHENWCIRWSRGSLGACSILHECLGVTCLGLFWSSAHYLCHSSHLQMASSSFYTFF